MTAEKEKLKQQLTDSKKEVEKIASKNRELKDHNARLTDRVRELRSEVSALKRESQEESKSDPIRDEDPELD